MADYGAWGLYTQRCMRNAYTTVSHGTAGLYHDEPLIESDECFLATPAKSSQPSSLLK